MKSSSVCLFLTLCTSFTFFSACNKEDSFVDSPVEEIHSYSDVPPLLWDYFQRFEAEALQRGYIVDLNAQNITAEIMEISEDGVAGSCTYSSHEPNHIVIDKTFWNKTSDLYKEMVLFHELGHCVLYRGHREDVYQDGTCVSIMRSGIGECYDNYRNTTRAVYLDELFEDSN